MVLTESSHSEPRKIYLANDEHTDFLWTADAETYNRVLPEMIDYYLRLADITEGHPSPYQSRFCCDGSYWLWVYAKTRSASEFQRVIDRLRSGHLSAPMTALASCYGGQPAEAVLRGMAYAGQLERRHQLKFSLAVAMENQTLPVGLASLWAGAGARYSWRGVCACASKLPSTALQRRPHEIYWATGLDGQRVLMKWHSLAGSGNQLSGGYAEAFDPLAAIRFLDQDADFLQRYRPPGADMPYAIRAAFGFGWDALDRKTGQDYPANPKSYPRVEHFHEIARAQSTADRQVIVSNEEDFFRDFEARYGDKLPSMRVTYGNEWDLYSASMAETTARVKRAVEKLRSAEALATWVSLQNPAFLNGREPERDLAFMNLGLYWEHDWTADGPVPRDARAAWQKTLATEIERYVDRLQADAANELGKQIPNPGATTRFYVFNPLGWTRTDAADFPYQGSTNIHVRDLTSGREVPHQFMGRADDRTLRILAQALPPVGYKVFEIQEGPGTTSRDASATVSQDRRVIENDLVRLTVAADGAISSFIDKRRGNHELAANIDGRWLNDFAANSSEGQEVVLEESGPVSVTLKCESSAGGRHTTRVTLLRDSDRVFIDNEITENFSDVRHWAFSFNLPSPDVHTEEVGAVIRVKTAREGGDYADSLARYDYATMNHFADVTEATNSAGVTLSNWDCSFVRLGRSTPEKLDTQTPQLHVLAGGQVDGDNLGIRRQDGDRSFRQRFGLRPHGPFNPTEAMKFALEHQNPPVTGVVTGGANRSLPAAQHSLITLSNSNILLWALKPHNDGIAHGIVARLWNLTSDAHSVRIGMLQPLKRAARITHIETSIALLPVATGGLETAVPGRAMESFLLQSN